MDQHVAFEAGAFEEGLAAAGPRACEELPPLRHRSLAFEQLLRVLAALSGEEMRSVCGFWV